MATTFIDVLESIQSRLVGNVIADIGRVILCARRKNIPHLDGDADILLRPKGMMAVDTVRIGTGRNYMMIRRMLEVIPRTRAAGLDQAGKDRVWLTKEAVGHIAFEDLIVNWLEQYQDENLFDSDGGPAMFLPMRLIDSTDPDRDLDPDNKWGSSILRFEVSYRQDMNRKL